MTSVFLAIAVDAIDANVTGAYAFSSRRGAEAFLRRCYLDDIKAWKREGEDPDDKWPLDRIEKLALWWAPDNYQPWTIKEVELDGKVEPKIPAKP